MLPAPTTMCAAEQRALDRHPAPAQRGVQVRAGRSAGSNGSRPRPASSRAAGSGVDRAGDQTTAPKRRGSVRRSVPRARDQVEVVVRPGRAGRGGERERARHAQVHQQAAAIEREPEVLAAPARPRRHVCATSDSRLACRAASAAACRARTAGHAGAADAVGEAAPRDFDLGKFGHAGNYRDAGGSHPDASGTLYPSNESVQSRRSRRWPTPPISVRPTAPDRRRRWPRSPAPRCRRARSAQPAAAGLGRAAPAAQRPQVENSALDAPAVLPAADRRDRAAQRRGRHRLPGRCSTPHGAPRDEQLFRRATDIALQARAGDAGALRRDGLARWPLPESVEALRYQIQLLVALNRTAEPSSRCRHCSRLTPRPAAAGADQRAAALLRPRRRPQRARPSWWSRRLQPYADAPDTQRAARVAIGRAWLAALDDRARRSSWRAARQPPIRRRRAGAARRSRCCRHAGGRGDRHGLARARSPTTRRAAALRAYR